MNRARLAALSGLVGAVIVLVLPFAASPASAADEISVTINRPGTDEAITGSSSFAVSGTATPILLVEVHAARFEILRAGTVVKGDSMATSADYSFPVALDTNGLYTLKVFATGRSVAGLFEASGYADRDFSVAVPPAPPGNVTASVGDDRRVTLAWTGVSYPDLRGYAIYRKVQGSSAFTLIGGVVAGTHTFTEASPTLGGAIQYQVVSLRNGAVASNDPDQWLRSSPFTTSVPVPAPPAPPPGPSTSSVPPGGGSQPTDATNNLGLDDIFTSVPTATPSVQTSPTPTIPDTGYSNVLPFTSIPAAAESTDEPGKITGRAPGRPSSASASGDLSAGQDAGSSTNRRALLVPVAAGSVLCVAALHLRWLNRRLAVFPGGGAGGGAGGDLEPTDVGPADLATEAFGADRLPVGAGK